MPATVSIEMWERFSFYGMQAILAYYLYYATTDGGLGLERAQATTLLGAYGAPSTCAPSPEAGSATALSEPKEHSLPVALP